MKSLLILFALSISTSVFAKSIEHDYTCEGADRLGKKITIKYDEWADNRSSTRVDLTIDKDGVGPRTTVDLYAYADNEGGFDFGVTHPAGAWMFHIIRPPNFLGNDKVAARFYYDNDFSIENSVELVCTEGLK